MSTCAVMLVKDEADIIGYTVEHLLGQVDAIIVADNASTDGTREILDELSDGGQFQVLNDPKVGYMQSDKTSVLAALARRHGHTWVVPCDADECWYSPDGRRVSEVLEGLAPDAGICKADLYHHFPTDFDDPLQASPFARIRWRLRSHGVLPKVAVRAVPGVVIEAGNHGARFQPGTYLTSSTGLALRHFSWRSAEQYVQKIRNGQRAYAATDLPEDVGAHWRMFNGADDDAIRAHFQKFFYFDALRSRTELVEDPAPGYDKVRT